MEFLHLYLLSVLDDWELVLHLRNASLRGHRSIWNLFVSKKQVSMLEYKFWDAQKLHQLRVLRSKYFPQNGCMLQKLSMVGLQAVCSSVISMFEIKASKRLVFGLLTTNYRNFIECRNFYVVWNCILMKNIEFKLFLTSLSLAVWNSFK
ncbi:LOW QUALITY PROTEIN: hypothetical protein PanWU01x14_092540 [Parasponia andersonii]|uniref:Uncharacterized protein n=1 Tax=Parasponia andersonii TaxID=3476 RepID=A0A2P5D6L8_PARAD|nr:LOW QUALITY PROTEIN: hypothetical protein PanWU01x14_092540 [Parasponia andersonii]